MVNSVDFILPSCYGIPESMWVTASAVLDVILKRCWVLLSAFVVVKMLISAFNDLGGEGFSLRVQLKILAQSFLIAIFLTYYKTFLMTFDDLIKSLCFFEETVVRSTVAHTKKVPSLADIILRPSLLLDVAGNLLSFFSMQGAIRFMHYIKAVALLILSQLGPFAALFSLLPGPFNASFRTWSKGYINVSCWTITLAIMDTLGSSFLYATIGSEQASTFLSFVLFIATLFTPTWTAKLISGINLGNLAAGVGSAPGRALTAVRDVRSTVKGQGEKKNNNGEKKNNNASTNNREKI